MTLSLPKQFALDERRALETVRQMVRFDSRTETEYESAVIDWVLAEMADLGLEVHKQEVGPGRYNAIGLWRGGSGPSLMFNGHVDTNPVTEGWTVDPWGGVVDDTFVYGLGVSNMKAGCSSYLEAVRALRSAGLRPSGDVVLTFVVGELQGGIGTRRLIEDGWSAGFFVNCEPTDLTALTEHAGALEFVIELTGDTRHLSKREEAADALAAAADLAPAINAISFLAPEQADGDSISRAHVGVLRAGLGRDLLDTRPPQVADVARLHGSARYSPAQEPRRVLQALRDVVDEICARHPGVEAQLWTPDNLDAPGMALPFSVDPGSPIVHVVNEAYRHVRGVEQPTGAIRPYCYYGSDAALLRHGAGMPGIVCGPGGKYNTMPDERVHIVDYLDAIRMHALTISGMEQLAGSPRPASS
jgi:acetylornithine deacetylase